MNIKLTYVFIAILCLNALYTVGVSAMEVYDVGHNTLCKAVILNNNIYYTSSSEHIVGEYDTLLLENTSQWNTGNYIPTQMLTMPNENAIVVLLNEEYEYDYRSHIGVIDLDFGSMDVIMIEPEIKILNFTIDNEETTIFASCEDGLTGKGSIIKISTDSWEIYDSMEACNYPLGIAFTASDKLIITCQDIVFTDYGQYYQGPPTMSKVEIYNTLPRYSYNREIVLPEGLNYMKIFDNDKVMTFHVPMNTGSAKLCIVDEETGLVEEILIESGCGVLDAVYYQPLERIYALIVREGAYDPIVEVPILEYTRDMLVYDVASGTYIVYEDYFNEEVGMIELNEGKIVTNSIESDCIYVDVPI